ncbi:MAG: NAD-dependent deacetylase [Chitinivibrionales bacterium]|nr:NAD-dependent deacetylase [Chitinivibrionales bacterium]
MQRLIEALKKSRYCVALTGAGVSTLSGVRDFRGKDGFYRQKGIDADRIFSLPDFLKDPSYYYQHTAELIYSMDTIEPSIVHTELARLEQSGIVKAVITQNIDLLHQRAGSKRVIELHGTPMVHRCVQCARQWPYEEIAVRVRAGEVPRCDVCGGVIKPDIIFFGEMLNPSVIEEAVDEACRADLMLVLGSSLVVQPAASIPLQTVERGGRLFIVNDMPTPLDRFAERRYDDLAECFEYIAAHV